MYALLLPGASEPLIHYTHVEIDPCTVWTHVDGLELVEAVDTDDEASFWGVSLRLATGGAENVADCPSRASAETLAAALSALLRAVAAAPPIPVPCIPPA